MSLQYKNFLKLTLFDLEARDSSSKEIPPFKLKISFNNQTHESEKKIREIYLSTVYAHVFHKAQECAINLYIEGNYLKKMNIVIGLILAIFSIF